MFTTRTGSVRMNALIRSTAATLSLDLGESGLRFVRADYRVGHDYLQVVNHQDILHE